MIALLKLSLLLCVSFGGGYFWPFYWKRMALVTGLVWGYTPWLLRGVGMPGLVMVLGIPSEASFLLIAWPLLMLSTSSVGAFYGRSLGISSRRRRGY